MTRARAALHCRNSISNLYVPLCFAKTGPGYEQSHIAKAIAIRDDINSKNPAPGNRVRSLLCY